MAPDYKKWIIKRNFILFDMETDCSFHYLKLLDDLINKFIGSAKTFNPDCFNIHDCSSEVALKKYLFFSFALNSKYREKYNDLKRINTDESEITGLFYELLFGSFSITSDEKFVAEEEDRQYIEKTTTLLGPYKGKILYYAYNERLLRIALPVLSEIPEEVVILSAREIPESLECSDNLSAIQFNPAGINFFPNTFIKTRFPGFYTIFNNLEFFIRTLMPKSIVVVEGVHFEFEMLASIGKKYNIPSVCIQHGWPGILHSLFREMQYDKFLTWGDGFLKLLQPLNPMPEFISTGYPFKILPFNQDKRAISFFFQGPFFISNNTVINQMTEFAIFCAATFQNYQILIREHPQYGLDKNMRVSFDSFKNVFFVPPSTHTLKEVLEKSLLSVSVFSSVLMESLLYGSIPFIFNLTSMPGYSPDLHKEGVGIEVKSLEQAKSEIIELLKNTECIQKYQGKVSSINHNYFSSTGDEAIKNIVNEIVGK